MKEQHARIHVENILRELPETFTTRDVLRALDLNFYESVAVISANLRALVVRGKVREVGRGRRNTVIWARNTAAIEEEK